MTRKQIIDAWNAQADYMNTWQHLGEDEKLDWAIKLEREAFAKFFEDHWRERWTDQQIVEAIRARGQA